MAVNVPKSKCKKVPCSPQSQKLGKMSNGLSAATVEGLCYVKTLQGAVLFAAAATARFRELGGLKRQTSTSHTSGGWKSEITVPALSGGGESFLSGSQMATLSLCLHLVESALVSLLRT